MSKQSIDGTRALETGGVLADSALVVLASFSGGAFLFLANLWLARLFGPEQFGQFRVIISFFSVLVLLVECGTATSLVKYVSELGVDKSRDLVRKILLLRALLFFGLAGVVFLFRESLASHVLKDESLTPYITAGAIFVCCIYFEIFRSIALAHQKIGLFAGSMAAAMAANGGLAVGFAVIGGVPAAVVGWSLGYLVGNAWSFYYAIRSGSLREGTAVSLRRIIFGYGLPMQVSQVIRSVEMAVVPLWSLFFGRLEIGALAFGMIFYRAVILLVSAFTSVLLPRFARMGSELERARASLRHALLLYTPIVIGGSAGAMVLAKAIITLVDPTYLSAVPILRLLVIYGLVSGYGAIWVTYCAGLGRVRPAILITVVQQIGLLVVSYLGLKALG